MSSVARNEHSERCGNLAIQNVSRSMAGRVTAQAELQPVLTRQHGREELTAQHTRTIPSLGLSCHAGGRALRNMIHEKGNIDTIRSRTFQKSIY